MALLEKAKIMEDLRVGTVALLAQSGHNTDKVLVLLHGLLGPVCLLFLLFGTFGVWPLLSQQGPGNHGPSIRLATSRVPRTSNPHWPRVASSSRGMPDRSRTWSFGAVLSSETTYRALIWATVSWLLTWRVCSSCALTESSFLATRSWTLLLLPQMWSSVGEHILSAAVRHATALISFCRWPVCAWK